MFQGRGAFAALLIQYSKPFLHHGKFNLSIPCRMQVKYGVGASLEYYEKDRFLLTFSHNRNVENNLA